jgi:hypothetical protein
MAAETLILNQLVDVMTQVASHANNNTTNFRRVSTADTNLVSLKATPGRLYSLVAQNTGAAVRFLKLYNKASAPVLATDVPVFTIPIPISANPVQLVPHCIGVYFPLGIAYAITGAAADTDATVIAAGEVFLNGTFS